MRTYKDAKAMARSLRESLALATFRSRTASVWKSWPGSSAGASGTRRPPRWTCKRGASLRRRLRAFLLLPIPVLRVTSMREARAFLRGLPRLRVSVGFRAGGRVLQRHARRDHAASQRGGVANERRRRGADPPERAGRAPRGAGLALGPLLAERDHLHALGLPCVQRSRPIRQRDSLLGEDLPRRRGHWKGRASRGHVEAGEDGAPDWIRTNDLQLRRLPLYPAELRAREGRILRRFCFDSAVAGPRHGARTGQRLAASPGWWPVRPQATEWRA